MAADKPSSAIVKAFSIIEAVISSDTHMQLNELAEKIGLPKPSVHRMLVQLEGEGIVSRDMTGKAYMTGTRLQRIALTTLTSQLRGPNVEDIMQRVVDTLGETCNLGVLDGTKVLYLHRVECDQPLRMFLQAGSRVPLHATAVGKLLLAFMPEEKRQALIDIHSVECFTPNTKSGDDLLAALEQIKEARISINREESTLGLAGVAVPIFGADGSVLAGLAIHAPISRFGDKQIARAIKVLRAAAAEIENDFLPA